MFKLADKKFEKYGFKKTEENEHLVQYERYNEDHKYTQYIVIVHKVFGYDGLGYALIQSYDPALFDEKKIGNTCVGLTVAEMRACIRKVKELRW